MPGVKPGQIRTPWHEFWRRFRGQPVAMGAGIFVLLLIAVAIVAPWIAPFNAENYFDYDRLNDGPSMMHWFGVDSLGRDIFSRVLVGAQISLAAGVLAVLIGAAIGTVLGLLAGYYEGWWDRIIMRICDVLFAFPGILLAIAVVAVMGSGMSNVIIAVAIFSIPAFARLVRVRHWRWAVLAQFCYVGAQTACWSYLIRYAIEEIPGMTPGFAANYLTGTMVCFFIGRFSGTWLISRFAPHKVLAAYALLAMLLCLISAFSGGHVGLLALTLCSAFMSIQYPTIFSLGIKNLGQDTKYGSSFIVMTIIGGGIVTPVMGFVSDAAGNIPTAELVPALCFAVIFIFARFRSQTAAN